MSINRSRLGLFALVVMLAVAGLTQTACKTLVAGAAGAAIGAAAQKHADRHHQDDDDDD
jgi:hypothetical protein